MSLIGLVVIGHNEGARLVLCLDAALQQSTLAVYVGSGSTDQSVVMARLNWVRAVFLVLGKFLEILGQIKFMYQRCTGQQSYLIEHK